MIRTDNPVLLLYSGEATPEYKTASTKNQNSLKPSGRCDVNFLKIIQTNRTFAKTRIDMQELRKEGGAL